MSLGGKPLTSTVDGHQGVTRETSVRPCLTENSPFSRHPPSTTRGRFEGRYSSPFKAPRNARKPRGGLEERDGVLEPVSIIFNTSSWYYPPDWSILTVYVSTWVNHLASLAQCQTNMGNLPGRKRTVWAVK